MQAGSSMKEPWIQLYRPGFPEEAGEQFIATIRSGQIASGSKVSEFEKELGSRIANPEIVATHDISTSLAMVLSMAGVGPGDEVLCSPMACLATNMPVLNLGARVRWCDIDPETGTMDPEHLEKRIRHSCKALLIYHWAGSPANLTALYEIAARHGLPVIEDASEALGAGWGGRALGATGSYCTLFSFGAIRQLTSIEGAAMAFSNVENTDQARRLRKYGIDLNTFRDADGEISPDSDIKTPGWFNQMNNVEATVGVLQLQKRWGAVESYRSNGLLLEKTLCAIPGVKPLKVPAPAEPSYFVLTLRVENPREWIRHLKQRGIHASQVHLRNDLYSCFGVDAVNLQGVTEFSRHCMAVPCGWWVGEEERSRIIQAFMEYK